MEYLNLLTCSFKVTKPQHPQCWQMALCGCLWVCSLPSPIWYEPLICIWIHYHGPLLFLVGLMSVLVISIVHVLWLDLNMLMRETELPDYLTGRWKWCRCDSFFLFLSLSLATLKRVGQITKLNPVHMNNNSSVTDSVDTFALLFYRSCVDDINWKKISWHIKIRFFPNCLTMNIFRENKNKKQVKKTEKPKESDWVDYSSLPHVVSPVQYHAVHLRLHCCSLIQLRNGYASDVTTRWKST